MRSGVHYGASMVQARSALHYEVCTVVKNEPEGENNVVTLRVKAEQEGDSIGCQAYVENASSDEEKQDRVLSMLRMQLKIVLAKYLWVIRKQRKHIYSCI